MRWVWPRASKAAVAGLSAVGATVSGSCGLWLGASGPHLVSWNCSTMWQLASEAERVTDRQRDREKATRTEAAVFFITLPQQ